MVGHAGQPVRIVEASDRTGLHGADVAARDRVAIGVRGNGDAVSRALAVRRVTHADLHVGRARCEAAQLPAVEPVACAGLVRLRSHRKKAPAHRLRVRPALVISACVAVVGRVVALSSEAALSVPKHHVKLKVVVAPKEPLLACIEAHAEASRVVHPVEAEGRVCGELSPLNTFVVYY